MKNEFDLIVVGGGVLGTFHAYHAIEKGLKVAILEKDKTPQGATTRNFGQVVPSGMNTKWQNYGRESLRLYKSIQEKFDISVRQNGTVYFASNDEEVTLLEELSQINKINGYKSEMLTKEACLSKYQGLRADYVKSGLYFPDEITVEPHKMILRLQAYLVKEKGLTLLLHNQVKHCEVQSGKVNLETASGDIYKAEKTIICNGSEFKTLFPALFMHSDLEVTKLQMMQTRPQNSNYKLPGSILTGLSIRRYESFHECPSFAEIKALETANSPEKRWSVHILFKQAADGSVIIGDSHQYADAANADDLGYELDQDINRFMLDEARKIINLPTYELQHQWFGKYAQCKNHDIFQHTIDKQIHIVTGIGGKGMTGSAGFSKDNIDKLLN